MAVLLVAALGLAVGALRGSLPRLDGRLAGVGLTSAVRIERDSRGVPTIEALTRTDLAYGTGFVHAQDRFFQMDLSRRLAAGELAELFGPIALRHDRSVRLFRFRSVAREVTAGATPAERAVLEAYARGVNAGLAKLSSRPWEYWVLRERPAPWRPEDTILVTYAMWWDLQSDAMRREIQRQRINAHLGGAGCGGGWKCGLAFLYPLGTSWDAPLTASTQALAPAGALVPGPEVLDVRSAPPPSPGSAVALRAGAAGSNNWAVAGRLTATGAALVANDMHLGLRVPTVWYHARLEVRPGEGAAPLDLNGVTLPGAPLLVAGSNGHIAWGFTNSNGTWFSVRRVPCSGLSPQALSIEGGGTMPLALAREEIRVHGAPPVTLDVRYAPLGVLVQVEEAEHSCWFASWLAMQPSATNLGLMAIEGADSVEHALALAPAIGIPHQNTVIGDAEGHIGWTIFGRIPTARGAVGAQGSVPWTTAADHPHVLDPPAGRIWTANARVAVDEGQQQLIGADLAPFGAEYDLGARASQIRDDLLALPGKMTPADMLRIQLDDQALFLSRWRTLLLSVLDGWTLPDHPHRAEFRQLVADWDARAGTGSVGYRLVRAYHDRTQQTVWNMILAGLHLPEEEGTAPPAQFERPLWQLVQSQPQHLLASTYPDWPAFLRAEVDATIDDLTSSCPELARCTWGARNVVHIRHPLSAALPWLASFLDMPTLELPGDHDMPRVQDVASGASERFAVSPGHESEGYLDLPGGQSGHPLSPYYRAGFMEWALGEPLPFLPGPAEHVMTLAPK